MLFALMAHGGHFFPSLFLQDVKTHFSKIVFSEYLKNLAQNLIDTYELKTNDVSLIDELDKIYLNLDSAIPCGLIVNELISNSLKFRRAQEPPRITVESYELPDHSWHFLISDNGIGITPENQENVFQLFNRLHNPGVSGIGLGLAHCRRIVELHNGKIWIESNMDAGITMHFVLPSNQLVDVSGN